MEELIQKLKELYDAWEKDNNLAVDGDDGRSYFKSGELADEVEGLANEHLITDAGGCSWGNMSKLKDAGYDVFPGEKDSFGWLTGCIKKKGDYRNPILVYG